MPHGLSDSRISNTLSPLGVETLKTANRMDMRKETIAQPSRRWASGRRAQGGQKRRASVRLGVERLLVQIQSPRFRSMGSGPRSDRSEPLDVARNPGLLEPWFERSV
jgi:hypothetical protein